jgi:hypothetical protein
MFIHQIANCILHSYWYVKERPQNCCLPTKIYFIYACYSLTQLLKWHAFTRASVHPSTSIQVSQAETSTKILIDLSPYLSNYPSMIRQCMWWIFPHLLRNRKIRDCKNMNLSLELTTIGLHHHEVPYSLLFSSWSFNWASSHHDFDSYSCNFLSRRCNDIHLTSASLTYFRRLLTKIYCFWAALLLDFVPCLLFHKY